MDMAIDTGKGEMQAPISAPEQLAELATLLISNGGHTDHRYVLFEVKPVRVFRLGLKLGLGLRSVLSDR